MSNKRDLGIPRAAGVGLWWVLAILLVVSRLLIGSYVVDDAYITFRYATHIVDLGEFSYNVGERILGTTTPLFTAILAAAYFARIAPESAAFAVAIFADLATLMLVLNLFGTAGRRDVALLGGTLIVISPAYLSYSVSGMETSLYVALLLGALVLYQRGQILWCGAVSGLCFLCRPDGALLVIVIACALWPQGIGTVLKFTLSAGAVAAPWLVFSIVYFGTPIPHSIVAKAADHLPWTTSWTNFMSYFTHGVYLLLTPLAICGAVLAWRWRNAAVRAWLIWGASYAVIFLMANAFTHFPWYFVPLLPVYFLCVAASLSHVVSRVARATQHTSAHSASRVVAAAALTIMVVGSWRLQAHALFLESLHRTREAVYRSTARHLAAIDPACLVAATEIGTVGYYYPGAILDLVGLVSPDAVGKDVGDVLERSRARWLVTYDTHFDRHVVSRASFAQSFRLVRSHPVEPNRSLELYERRFPVPCGALGSVQ